MKKSYLSRWFVLLFIPLILASCGKDKEETSIVGNDELYKSILEQYTSETIIPTYKNLADAALSMKTANDALKLNCTDANIQLAADAWNRARIYWEMSEAFLFGPVGDQALDIDGHIDSWPLELEDLTRVLAAGTQGLTGQEAWSMAPEVIGFHTTEYLLFRNGKVRQASDVTPDELGYLTAATDALVWDCVLAYVAWVGEDEVSSEMKTIFDQNPAVVAHLSNNPNYKNFAQKMVNATGYSSYSVALSEIAVGASEIAGEVGETKINAPYSEKKVEDVESWYSWHSLKDYQNNILSIKNAYLGGVDDQSRTAISLSSYIAKVKPNLDTEIKAKIDECYAKIGAIGSDGRSFYQVVLAHANGDDSDKPNVDAAVQSCIELQTLFDQLIEIIE
ncbi:MAG: hypothetical protein LWX70_04680 [Sphingobacteriia bacterium]|nr:hypothetical protein [Sphingobacteriia bacterium]